MRIPTGLLQNASNGRYHPIVFRHAPPPSGDQEDCARYKSIGHHTEGFNTEKEALDYIELKKDWEWIGVMWTWDGQSSAAMVVWLHNAQALDLPEHRTSERLSQWDGEPQDG
jgi:hypothetical protein